jgi:hypothetical protein
MLLQRREIFDWRCVQKSYNFRIRFFGEIINQDLNCPLPAIRSYRQMGPKTPKSRRPSHGLISSWAHFASVWPFSGHPFIPGLLNPNLIFKNPRIRFHSFF